jgi:hypothetical protein
MYWYLSLTQCPVFRLEDTTALELHVPAQEVTEVAEQQVAPTTWIHTHVRGEEVTEVIEAAPPATVSVLPLDPLSATAATPGNCHSGPIHACKRHEPQCL